MKLTIMVSCICAIFSCKTSVSSQQPTTVRKDSSNVPKSNFSNHERLIKKLEQNAKDKLSISLDSTGKKIIIFGGDNDFGLSPFGNRTEVSYLKTIYGDIFKIRIDTILDYGDGNPIIGPKLIFNKSEIHVCNDRVYFASIEDSVISLMYGIHVNMQKEAFLKVFFKEIPKDALEIDTIVFDHGFLENSLDVYFYDNKITRIKYTHYPD